MPKLQLQTVAKSLIAFIHQAIGEKAVLNLLRKNQLNVILIPYRVLYLDGSLCVIAEKVASKELVHIRADDIISVNEVEVESLRATYSEVEIDDFIDALRLVAGSGVRLVLKLYSQVSFRTDIAFQHFAGQCVFSNPQGDIIWAATIEPNENVFEWLSTYGSEVEILDPLGFKKQFLAYCEAKLKKLA